MKHSFALLLMLMCFDFAKAQLVIDKDTTANNKIFIYDDDYRPPEFPGGVEAFAKYIRKNLKYPPVARLIGLNGKINVAFTVDTNGKLTEITPLNCIGAGCDAEAERVLELSPKWKPGAHHNKRIKFRYAVPVSFSMGKKTVKTSLSNLRISDYGFVFDIKGALYTIDEAEKILGHSFNPNHIGSALPFYNYNKISKFDMPNKKDIYLIIMKKS